MEQAGRQARIFDYAAHLPLPLPSLSISGFRGIEQLNIGRLGRVTLLAGRNGIGKTTVLDAVRLFSERGHLSSLASVLTRSEEVAERIGPDDKRSDIVSCEALFYGRMPVFGAAFSVGSSDQESQLRLELVELDDIPPESAERLRKLMADGPVLRATFRDFVGYLPALIDYDEQRFAFGSRWTSRRRFGESDWPTPLNYFSLGPGLLANWELDRLWGDIALTPSEPLALNALQLASDLGVEGVAVVPGPSRYSSRRVVVKLASGQRVPLKSLGDGATRLFSVAAALGSSTNGFLLIDEAENGIHHSLQKEYWKFIIRTAADNDVQVVATTHSWDCVSGFANAARELDSAGAVLLRLERSRDEAIRAVEYAGDDLEVAVEQRIEVR
ncbi:MAG: AAA family ATPase [Gammaproteobacteria bacterium]|nr:AAA family ATPase [Gammaproteobacteria bacterium]